MNLHDNIGLICYNLQDWNQCQLILFKYGFKWLTTNGEYSNEIYSPAFPFPLILELNPYYPYQIMYLPYYHHPILRIKTYPASSLLRKEKLLKIYQNELYMPNITKI